MRPLELLFIFALILYSVAIFSHLKLKGRMRTWMLSLFGVGLFCDVLGTIILCFWSSKHWVWNTHTITGSAALLIMTLHFAWAYLARTNERYRIKFDRYSAGAWALWMVAFVSGIPRH